MNGIKALIDYLSQGGFVIIPLVVVSMIMWILIFEKLFYIQRWRKTLSARIQKYDTLQTLQAFAQKQTNNLKRYNRTIFILAGVAPLLGLLGTVTGMITTFDAISMFNTTNARSFASGISVALITTQIGLVVAIPGVLVGNYIQRLTERLCFHMDAQVAHFKTTNFQPKKVKKVI